MSNYLFQNIENFLQDCHACIVHTNTYDTAKALYIKYCTQNTDSKSDYSYEKDFELKCEPKRKLGFYDCDIVLVRSGDKYFATIENANSAYKESEGAVFKLLSDAEIAYIKIGE